MQNKKAINILINDIAMETESYFYGWGSTLWNKNKTTPTWALSPSYLYSQVKDASSKRFITSPTPLVGWANMGRRGTPVKHNTV